MANEFEPKMAQKFSDLLRLDNERKAREFEKVKQLVAASSIPLSDSVLERVLSLFPTAAHQALREHSGFIFAERREHYRASLSIMFQSLDDLAEALRNFERLATAETAEIMMPKNKDKLEAIERRIQKELFGVANAAASLVDHARRLNAVFKIPEFKDQVNACFSDDGLHDLVIGLRVLLHHLHIVKTGWSLSSDFAGTRTAEFRIDCNELERAIKQSGNYDGPKYVPMRELIQSYESGINLLAFFNEYRARLECFYDWLGNMIDNQPPLALQDYDRCILEMNRRSVRMGWNALIGNWLNWERIPDIHKHLPNYLRPEQLVAVYKLRRNSKEQVDLIIEYFDEYGSMNQEFRGRIYRLFQRLDEQEANAQTD